MAYQFFLFCLPKVSSNSNIYPYVVVIAKKQFSSFLYHIALLVPNNIQLNDKKATHTIHICKVLIKLALTILISQVQSDNPIFCNIRIFRAANFSIFCIVEIL